MPLTRCKDSPLRKAFEGPSLTHVSSSGDNRNTVISRYVDSKYVLLQNLAIEILSMNMHCQRHVPTVQPGGAAGAGPIKFSTGGAVPPVADLQSYNQYQAIVRTQLACAKEVHDALLDCAKKIQLAADRTSQQPASS